MCPAGLPSTLVAKTNAHVVEQGFVLAAKFLQRQRIYRVIDPPYRSLFVPVTATLAQSPAILEHAARLDRLSRWYRCGVFGKLYGAPPRPAWLGTMPK